jgi:hypothetical protein
MVNEKSMRFEKRERSRHRFAVAQGLRLRRGRSSAKVLVVSEVSHEEPSCWMAENHVCAVL